NELAGTAAMVKLIQVSLSNLNAITQRMRADVLRNHVRDVPGQVVAAFRRCQADLLKRPAARANDDVRRAKNILTLISSIRTQEDAHALCVETVVEVMENLIEVIGSKQKLIGHVRSECRIEHRRIVKHVNRRNLKVVLQV